MAEPWSKSVYSSRASEISYDPDSQELTVVWRRGGVTVYSGVPEDRAVALSKAASVGAMINDEFSGYSHRNIR